MAISRLCGRTQGDSSLSASKYVAVWQQKQNLCHLQGGIGTFVLFRIGDLGDARIDGKTGLRRSKAQGSSPPASHSYTGQVLGPFGYSIYKI